jgi:hypothetical protein
MWPPALDPVVVGAPTSADPKRARSFSKNGSETLGAMYQKTSPEVGCTKAVAWSHAKR